MNLGELIAALKAADPDRIIPQGFANPHSYRGYYDELAFEPLPNISVRHMLAAANSALGRTFTGYKGGDYTMDEGSPVWLAHYGSTGDPITDLLMGYLLAPPASDCGAEHAAAVALADATLALKVHTETRQANREGGRLLRELTATRDAALENYREVKA